MWWPKVPFAHGRQKISRSFATYALELLRFGTILARISHQPFGSPEHLFHYLSSEAILGKVNEPSLRMFLRHLGKQAAQLCTSVGEKYGLDVSRHMGVGWDLIKGLHKTYLAQKYREIDMAGVEYVSIDEFSIAKRHKYMTTIMDAKTGRILFAIEGRKKQDIVPALEELKKKHLSLKLLQWT